MVRAPPFQVVVRLCALLIVNYAAIEVAYYEIELLKQSPRKLMNLTLHWALERTPSDKVTEFMTELEDLLEWQSMDSAEAERLESESFMNAMKKGGG